MNEAQKKYVFEEEYEREHARDTYRSDKEKKSSNANKLMSYISDGFIVFIMIYLFSFLKQMGIKVKIIDGQFLLSLLLIVITIIVGEIIFRKTHKKARP